MALGAQNDPFKFKQNDNRPIIRGYARQGATGSESPIDLTNVSAVVFNARHATTGTVIVSRQAASVVAPATAGILQYTMTAAQTATNGNYLGEFEMTFSDGGILTVPNGEDWIYITIGDDIA